MNKTNTAETILNSVKTMCTERDRKERERLRENRLDIDKRKEAEKERLQNTNSILNSYIERAKERERQQSQEHEKMWQDIHENGKRRRIEEEQNKKEMSSVINRALVNASNADRKAADDFLTKHKKYLDKAQETIHRERTKTYFS